MKAFCFYVSAVNKKSQAYYVSSEFKTFEAALEAAKNLVLAGDHFSVQVNACVARLSVGVAPVKVEYPEKEVLPQ